MTIYLNINSFTAEIQLQAMAAPVGAMDGDLPSQGQSQRDRHIHLTTSFKA